MSEFDNELKRQYLDYLDFERNRKENPFDEDGSIKLDILECEGVLIEYLGLDEFQKIADGKIELIIGAMRQFEKNKSARKEHLHQNYKTSLQ